MVRNIPSSSTPGRSVMATRGNEAGTNGHAKNGRQNSPKSGDGSVKGVPGELAFVLELAVGTPIQVTTKDGDVLDGLFESHICINQVHGLAMRLARLVNSKRADKIKAGKGAALKFKFAEVTTVTVLNDADFGDLGKAGFATDTEISKTKPNAAKGGPRELAKWEASDAPGAHLTLEAVSPTAKLGSHWDQFVVNQQLFGITTSFDENIYTIPLDRTAKDYRARESEAEKIAEEIMSTVAGKSGNVHLAEERGEEIDDSGMDEEDKYGAVVRDSEAADKVAASTPHVPSRSRLTTHRKSITNVNADSESLEAALQVVQTASQTVHRRMSQINESDLAALLASESKEAHAKMDEMVKAKKLNPNASEFVPSFEASPALASPMVAPPPPEQLPYAQGYYPNQAYDYYEPYQTNAYYDPNYYYAGNPYYAQPNYYQAPAGGAYQSYTYQAPQDQAGAPHQQAPPNPEEP